MRDATDVAASTAPRPSRLTSAAAAARVSDSGTNGSRRAAASSHRTRWRCHTAMPGVYQLQNGRLMRLPPKRDTIVRSAPWTLGVLVALGDQRRVVEQHETIGSHPIDDQLELPNDVVVKWLPSRKASAISSISGTSRASTLDRIAMVRLDDVRDAGELEALAGFGVDLLVELDRVHDPVATGIDHGLSDDDRRRADVGAGLDDDIDSTGIERHQRGVVHPTPSRVTEAATRREIQSLSSRRRRRGTPRSGSARASGRSR